MWTRLRGWKWNQWLGDDVTLRLKIDWLSVTFFGISFRPQCKDFHLRLAQTRDPGTVAALIAVPYSMALVLAIGLRPEAGLYTSIIGGTLSGIISDVPVVASGLSATVVPVLAALVKTQGAGAALAAGALSGLIMALKLFRRLTFSRHQPPKRGMVEDSYAERHRSYLVGVTFRASHPVVFAGIALLARC
jgi:Sulfate permease family